MVDSWVGQSGKATVPVSVLRALKATPGTKLRWTALSDGTVVLRATTRTLQQLAGILTRPGKPSISPGEIKR